MRKKVLCIELNTTYDTVSDASKMLNIDKGNISKCCNGKLKSAGGYKFKYVDDVDANVCICNDNVNSELLSLKEENARLKEQVADLQAEIARLKANNNLSDDDGTSAVLVDRSNEFKALQDKFNEQFLGMSDADNYTTSTLPPKPPKPLKPPEPVKVQEKEEIKLPSFDNEQYNNEIKSCNDISRLKTIEDICNDVLNECSSIRKNNEYFNTSNLRLVELNARETRQMAVKKIESIKNPPPPPEPIEFHWSATERETNEMFLKEIVRFDEMMCENAIESHQNKLNEYKNLLQRDTLNESEYKTRIEFEEKYISKVKEQQQNLIQQRIDFNESYEMKKFNFVEFEKLKNNAEKMIDKINQTNVCSTNVDTIKESIKLHRKKINHDLRELKDSITQDGIIYNRYAIAMRSHFINIVQAKLTAYDNDKVYITAVDKQEQSDIDKLERLMKNISLCDTEKLKSIKDKIYNKVNSYELYKENMYVSKMCVCYHKVTAELQSKF